MALFKKDGGRVGVGVVLLLILEVIRHGQWLKGSINLHYGSKHVIHRCVNAVLLTIWTNSNRQ